MNLPTKAVYVQLALRNGGYYADGQRFPLRIYLLAIAFNRTFPCRSTLPNHLQFGEAEVLPEVFHNNSYDLWLVGPRIDVTVANKLKRRTKKTHR
jgi:hypothetical protein